MIRTLFEWVWAFVSGMEAVFSWLLTPLDIAGLVDIAPIFLVVGSAATVGLIRRIL